MKRLKPEEQQQEEEEEEQHPLHSEDHECSNEHHEHKRLNNNHEQEHPEQPEEKKIKLIKEKTDSTKLTLVSLENLGEKGVDELAAIAADPVVMKFIGNSKPWGREKVQELVDGAIGDKSIPAHKREYFSWAISSENGEGHDNDNNSSVIGLVALRPTKDRRFSGLQFRIFVKNTTQRRGVGSEALGLMFKEYKRRLDESFGDGKERKYRMFAFSRMDNEAASKCFRKCGMNHVGTKRFGKEVENAWEIML